MQKVPPRTNTSMKVCILLAGGKGTRLKKLFPETPKCLVPISNDKTFLEFQVECLANAGVDKIILSLGFMAEKVIKFIEKHNFSVPVDYVIENEPLGTAGAINYVLCKKSLENSLVANADTWISGNIRGMMSKLRIEKNEFIRMAVIKKNKIFRYGSVCFNKTNKIVTRFIEKKRSNSGFINAGLYNVSQSAFKNCPNNKMCSLENQILPLLASNKFIRVHEIKGEIIDIGIPEDYAIFCKRYSYVSK